VLFSARLLGCCSTRFVCGRSVSAEAAFRHLAGGNARLWVLMLYGVHDQVCKLDHSLSLI
jgi:hypothetical protein